MKLHPEGLYGGVVHYDELPDVVAAKRKAAEYLTALRESGEVKPYTPAPCSSQENPQSTNGAA